MDQNIKDDDADVLTPIGALSYGLSEMMKARPAVEEKLRDHPRGRAWLCYYDSLIDSFAQAIYELQKRNIPKLGVPLELIDHAFPPGQSSYNERLMAILTAKNDQSDAEAR